MQNLTYEDMLKQKQSKEFPVPIGMHGVSVDVQDGKDDVRLTVDGREIVMTIGGARALALALRQSANRVEKIMFPRKG